MASELDTRAKMIAQEVLDELTDRKGFDNAWDDCSRQIQREIRYAVQKIIRAALQHQATITVTEEGIKTHK